MFSVIYASVVKTRLSIIMIIRLLTTALLMPWTLALAVQPVTSTLRLELRPHWSGQSLTSTTTVSTAEVPAITRLDCILSQLELQRTDGTWLPAKDWFGFYSMAQSRFTADATGVPEGSYQAIKFVVGLDQPTNDRTPDTFATDHSLRPAIDIMHWGWMGGFIFLALEGRSQNGAFSYHLANNGNTTEVTVPVVFQGGRPVTISLGIDVSKILAKIDFVSDPKASHSRPSDPIIGKLRDGVSHAFTTKLVSDDLFQVITPSSDVEAPAGTHPVSLRVPQKFPQMQLPADNPLTEEGIELGGRLFQDKRLSVNNTQSCASCHDRAHALADPRRVSLGAEGAPGKRNAMALFNLGWHNGFFWDGRASTLREQVLMPVQDIHEMNERMPRVVAKLEPDKSYAQAFKAAFGTPEINSERIAKALEQHLLSLTSYNSKFDLAVRKQVTLTDSETRGLKLFVTEYDPVRGLRGADCFHCHGGMLFTDHQFHNNGLERDKNDIGRSAVTHKPEDEGKFKTPSLRNIAVTAPYMHDGRFATLKEVIEHYDHGVVRNDILDPNLAKHPANGLRLTSEEKADLIAFLRTLTDETFIGASAQFSNNTETSSHP